MTNTQVELYLFESMGQSWGYTSANIGITYGDFYFEPEAISRTEVEHTQDIHKSDVNVRVPRNNDVGLVHLQYAPESVTTLTIFRGTQWGDPDAEGWTEFNVFWKGRVVGAKGEGGHITLMTESVFTSLRRPGLRARYQRTCRHALYHRGCRLDPEDFAVIGTLESVNGAVVSVTQAAYESNGWYLGGMFRAPDGVLRLIVRHTGKQLTLSRPIPFLESMSGSVKIYPGCDHTRGSGGCAKFDNMENYGGFPWIPSKNPFGGSSLV